MNCKHTTTVVKPGIYRHECVVCGRVWHSIKPLLEVECKAQPTKAEAAKEKQAEAVQQADAQLEVQLDAQAGADTLGVTWEDGKNYAKALANWVKAGRPERTQAEVERCLAVCQSNRCRSYVTGLLGGRCSSCRCRVNSGPAIVNKIRMATENCPKGNWSKTGDGLQSQPRKEGESWRNENQEQNQPLPKLSGVPRNREERHLMQQHRRHRSLPSPIKPPELQPTLPMLKRAEDIMSSSVGLKKEKSAQNELPTTSLSATSPPSQSTSKNYLPSLPSSLDIPPPIPGKIDVVYPLGTESKWDDNEIRYSLRSLAKNFPDLGRVWIIGHKPAWLTGVVHIPMEDYHKHNKDANLIDKVLAACQAGVSEQFVFCSDDQVFLRPIQFKDMRPLHYADITNTPDEKWGKGSWWARMRAVRDELKRRGFTSIKNYDSHCPTPYDRDKYAAIIPTFDYAPPPGYTINTLYCNAAKVAGQPVKGRKHSAEEGENDDEKIRGALRGKDFLGYSDAGLTDTFKQVLAEMFPEKSKFEEGYVQPEAKAIDGGIVTTKSGWQKRQLKLEEQSGFNGALFDMADSTLCIYRGSNSKSLKYTYLDSDLNPVGEQRDLGVWRNEDPRVVCHENRVYLSTTFSWYKAQTRVELRELGFLPDGTVLNRRFQLFDHIANWPEYTKPPFEKNWVPFSHDENLYYIYSLSPHRVLRVDLKTEAVSLAYTTETPASKWQSDCHLRLNAPPVLLPNGNYLSTYHVNNRRKYYTGFYEFEGKPPFSVLRMSSEPELWPDDCREIRRKDKLRCVFIVSMQVDKTRNIIRLTGGDSDMSVVVLEKSLPLVMQSLA